MKLVLLLVFLFLKIIKVLVITLVLSSVGFVKDDPSFTRYTSTLLKIQDSIDFYNLMNVRGGMPNSR